MAIIPEALYEDIRSGNSVLFAGAGVSTEGGPYGKPTFYDHILEKSGYPRPEDRPPFPDLMQYYCDHVDGGLKNRLTREIIWRIEEFSAPGEIHSTTTAFHRLTARIPFFNRVVTTNWDPFFEQAMNVLVAMVEDRDVPFWDDGKRQVLKIHGCVTRPYTMVATRIDYDQCADNNHLVFTKLKDLVATKTFIYVGFSMGDPDFKIVLDEIIERLGRFKKLSYAIDPSASPETQKEWEARQIRIIKAAGVGFMYELVDCLIRDGILVSTDYLAFLQEQHEKIVRAHFELDQSESDGAFASAMYQDGVDHVLVAALSGSLLGRSKDAYEHDLSEATRTLRLQRKKNNPIEIAHWSGRVEVLRRFCSEDTTDIPAYFDPQKLEPSHRYVKWGSSR